ncbi:MAG: ribosome assembly factor SBDS [Candidatus Woesearchaeota archaeon]
MRQTYDPEKFNLNVAVFRFGGETFEIVVNPDAAIAFKETGRLDVLEVLSSEKIFSDAQRGQLAPEAKFESVFGTKDVVKIAEHILRKGEVSLTAEHRKKQIEKKKAQIVTFLQRNSIDPRMGTPHTKQRIEDALGLAKIHIDEFKPVDEQVKDIIRKLQPILPLKFEVKRLQIHVDPRYSHSVYGYLKKYTVKQTTWGSDQGVSCILEIPAGLESEFYDMINGMTHGSAHIDVLKN